MVGKQKFNVLNLKHSAIFFSPLHFIQVEEGNIGERYKIKIGHDTTSEQPQPQWNSQKVMFYILCFIVIMKRNSRNLNQ